MIQEKTTHPFDLLYFIADDLHSSSEEYLLSLDKILQQDILESSSEELAVVRDVLNTKVSTHIDAIAKITGNDRYTLRQVFTPSHKGAVWFIDGAALSKNVQTPEQFLRKVAEFKSFHPDAWTHSVVDRLHIDLYEDNSTENPPSPA